MPVNPPIYNFINSQNGEEQELCCLPRPFCSQCDEKDREIKRLKEALESSKEKVEELEAINNALIAKEKSLVQLLFGRSTKKDPFPEEEPTEPTEEDTRTDTPQYF